MKNKIRKKNTLNELAVFRGVASETLEYLWNVGRVYEYPKGTLLIRGYTTVVNNL